MKIQRANIITMPQVNATPCLSPRDMELLLGGVVRLMKKYAQPYQIVDFIKSLQGLLTDEEAEIL